jgi:hypothetical protein
MAPAIEEMAWWRLTGCGFVRHADEFGTSCLQPVLHLDGPSSSREIICEIAAIDGAGIGRCLSDTGREAIDGLERKEEEAGPATHLG